MLSQLAELKQAEIVYALRRSRPFLNLPPADLNGIAASSAIKTLARGEHLFYEGAPAHGCYVVLNGAIKLYRNSLKGREQVLHVFRPPESFGEETLVSEEGHLASACALRPARILLVPKAEILAVLRRQPELALGLFRSLSQQVSHLVRLLDDLTLKDARTRLAHWLIQRCPTPESDEPCTIPVPMTKRLLAAELGVASETFSRTIARLRHDRLLAVEGKNLVLLSPSRLAQSLAAKAGPGATVLSPPLWPAVVRNGHAGVHRAARAPAHDLAAGLKPRATVPLKV